MRACWSGASCRARAKAVAGAGPVLGQERVQSPADGPRACPQIRIIRRSSLGGGEAALHLPGLALVCVGEALHQHRRRGQRDQAEPFGGLPDLARHLYGVLEPSRHRVQRGDIGADPDRQADRADPERLGAGQLETVAAGITQHFDGPELIEDPEPVHPQAGGGGHVEGTGEGRGGRVKVTQAGAGGQRLQRFAGQVRPGRLRWPAPPLWRLGPRRRRASLRCCHRWRSARQ